MMLREWLCLPNLLSLSRVVLAPVVVYFLGRSEEWSIVAAASLCALAGVTDGLDGYLARRAFRVTALGVALDPIADKIFALIVAAGLILYREFPLWLAGLVVLRDLLILSGGAFLLRRRQGLSLPSNLTGKWAFAALAVLLGAHVIRFQWSIHFMTPIVTVLLLASLGIYGRSFFRMRHGLEAPPFDDRPAYRLMRIAVAVAVSAAHLIMFWVEFLR